MISGRKLKMLKAYKNFWRGYINWSGRASLLEYWQDIIINILILLFVLILTVLYSKFTGDIYGPAFLLLFSLPIYFVSIVTPFISLIIRRLRDSAFHWSWIFFLIIPFVGWLILFIINQFPSKMDNFGDSEDIQDGINAYNKQNKKD